MKIDYCTFMVAERERDLLTIHLNSLRHYCPGMFNIKVSAVEAMEIPGAEVIPMPFYKQISTSRLNLGGYDAANRMDILLREHCDSQWAVIAHADIVYHASLWDSIKELMHENTGMIGVWAHGLTVINRKIYAYCHAGFWPFFGMHLATNDNLVGLEERSPECHLVASLDVAELLSIEIQGLGYHRERKAVNLPYEHIAGQSHHWMMGVPKDSSLVQASDASRASAIARHNQFMG